MNELEHPIHIWQGLQSIFNSIIEYAAAASAWDDLQKKRNDKITFVKLENKFLITTVISLKIQLITELSKFFDKEKTCGKANCSLKKFKDALQSDSRYSSNSQTAEYIQKIDELCERFEKVVSVDVRNKILAHNDLEQLFLNNVPTVNFTEVYKLVKETKNLIENVCSVLIGGKLEMIDFEKIEKQYKESLCELLDGV